MAKFKECEFCHCALDFGERCDCAESVAERTGPKGLSAAEIDFGEVVSCGCKLQAAV